MCVKRSLSVLMVVPAAVALLACGSSAASGQEALELSGFFPPGALVYAEVNDFGGNLQKFLETDFASKFPAGRAFADFTRTKLYNKLADRLAELQQVTGFSLSMKTAREIAGSRAALALYDIGELRLLFLTRIPAEKLALAELWKLRDKFEERRVGDLSYYVKEDPDGRVSLAFAVKDDLFLIGTDAILFEQSMQLLSGAADESLARDERFARALPGDFSFGIAALILDQERIADTPHFRSYWIWGNQQELKPIKSVAVSLALDDGALSERRWIVSSNPAPAAVEDARALAAALPAGADFYGCWKLNGQVPFGQRLADEFYTDADGEFARGLEEALKPAQPTEYALASKAAFDESGFVLDVGKCAAVRLAQPGALDRRQLEKALAGYFERKLLPPGQGDFSFVDKAGYRTLEVPLFDGALPAYAIRDRVLVLDNASGALIARAGAGGDARLQELIGSARGAASLLLIDFAASADKLIGYFRIVSQRDNWSSSANAAFFWRNAVSLLESLGAVSRITIVRSPENGGLVEEIRYHFKQ